MGFYRLLLALLVVFTHLGLQFHGIVEGVSAVISFYLLSGFVMTALVRRYYASPADYWAFLADRAARICPQFYCYLALTILALLIFRPPSQVATHVTWLGAALNGLIVPLGLAWFMLNDRVYLPQGWSLGLELMFYIVFPFLLIFRLRLVALALSFLFSMVAMSGVINSDIYGYRLLPGTLYIFMLGSLMYDCRHDRWPRLIIGAWCAGLLLLGIILWRFDMPYNKEVILGLLIGLPAVWMLRFQPSSRLDSLAGNLSYGVFLNHFAVIFALQGMGISVGDPPWAAAIVAACLGLAWLSYHFVEAPVLTLRRALRSRTLLPTRAV